MAISGSQRPTYLPSPLESNLPSGRLANASSGSNPNVVALDAGTPESTGKPREQPFLPQRLFGQESVELVEMHITDHERRLKHVGLLPQRIFRRCDTSGYRLQLQQQQERLLTFPQLSWLLEILDSEYKAPQRMLKLQPLHHSLPYD